MKDIELRLLRKATTKPKKTHRYLVEVLTARGFKTKYLKIQDTDMRARTGNHYELVNLSTGNRRTISRTRHSNIKDKLLQRRKKWSSNLNFQ